MKNILSGVYKTFELEKRLGNRMAILSLVEAGELQRVSQGLYATSDIVDDRQIAILSVKKFFPEGIVSKSTALNFHDLYDYPGDFFHIDIDPEMGRIKEKGYLCFHRCKNVSGVGQGLFNGVKLKVYLPERAVFEALSIEPGVGRIANEVLIKYFKNFNSDGKGLQRLSNFSQLFGSRGERMMDIAKTIEQINDIY